MVTHRYMSSHPSLLISTTEAPLLHLPSPLTFASSVISVNSKCPLFRYNLLETRLPVKYKSGSPSLLKSPTATPPPLYINSRSMGLIESFSVILLLKNIPDAEDGIFLNKVGVVLQAVIMTPIKIYVDRKIKGDSPYFICSIISATCGSKKLKV